MADDDDLIPDSGAVFTFGRSRFADNIANKFWIKNDPVFHVACGDEHSAVLTERGRVYVFGSNEWGQLGLGHTKPSNKPSFIKALKPEKIILLACGRSHTLAYAESKKLFSFGSNSDGQLGYGPENTDDSHSPNEITHLAGIDLKSISCGAYHSVILTAKGEVYVWGVNSDGQLGLGEDVDETAVPTKLSFKESVISISCGYYHTASITESGLLYTFGENENGKLGLSDSKCDNTTFPQAVTKLENDKYKSVSCGARHTVATTEKGCCYSWGDGSHGQLGHGTMAMEVPLPKQIDLLHQVTIIFVSCGDGHTAVISDKGNIYTFGDGRHGKLGQGDECFSNLFKPTIITRFKGFQVKFVDCGGCHMLVGAIRKTNADKIDCEEIVENSLDASMRSNKSIPDANMTLKPGSITYPLVSARDKRRHKKDDSLDASINLNSSLNSSLNMAQLNRTVVQLPTVLDRNRLPKIPGVKQITINNYANKESKTIKEENEDRDEVDAKKDESKNNSKPSCSKDLSKELAPLRIIKKTDKSDDVGSDGSKKEKIQPKEDKMVNGSKSKIKNVQSEDSKLNRSPLKKFEKVEESEEEEEEDSFEDPSDDEVKKRVEKNNKKSVKSPVHSKSKKQLKKSEPPSDEIEDDYSEEEDLESIDEEEDSTITQKKQKNTSNKDMRNKSKQKVLSDEEIKGKKKKEKLQEREVKSTKKSKKIVETEDEEEDDEEENEEEVEDEETEEDEESEEESEKEVAKNKKNKKDIKEIDTKKGVKCKGKKNDAAKNNKSEKKISKKGEKKTPEKKKNAKKMNDEEDDEDDDEEEEDEEEENDEEEEEDDEEEEEGGTKKGKKGKSKQNNKNTEEKTEKAEESKPEPNRSGFLNFFRRNKKPTVDIEPSTTSDTSPEKSQTSTNEATNPNSGGRNQSKTCTIL